jgi:hypothetical protein
VNAPPLLEPFRSLIGWEAGAEPLAVVGEYANALALRLVRVAGGDAPGSGPDGVARALDLLDTPQTGGVVSGLTWPPIAAMLLGRGPRPPSLSELEALLQPQLGVPALGADNLIRPEGEWSAGAGPGQAMTGYRRQCAAARVARAWTLVNQLGERVSALARICTRVIVLRSSDAGQVGSWSTDELIGCTVLFNADSDHFPVATLAEALVHEAIHHVQAMYEIRRPFVADPSLATSPTRYPSPWSGQPLTAKSLLAACFVWYAIAAMWATAGDEVAGADERAAHQWRASRGFVADDPAATVSEFAWALDPDVPAVVAALQDVVRSLWAQRRGPPRAATSLTSGADPGGRSASPGRRGRGSL